MEERERQRVREREREGGGGGARKLVFNVQSAMTIICQGDWWKKEKGKE